MVAIGISSVVILGVATVMNMGMREFTTIYEQNKTLESIERATYFLRLYVQNAINVRACPAAIPSVAGTRCAGAPLPFTFQVDQSTGYFGGAALPSGRAGFDSTTVAADGRAYPVGIFLTESGGYSPANNYIPQNPTTDGSLLRPMAIWFQTPKAGFAGRFASGVLWIDGNAGPGAVPTADDLWFDRMTRLNMEVFPAPGDPANPSLQYGPAWQVDFELTARYFLVADQSYWWYDVDPASCPVACRDVTRNIRVVLRNNALGISQVSSMGVVERSQGSVYYFKLALPIAGQFIQSN